MTDAINISSDYDASIAAAVCEHIADGLPLAEACERAGGDLGRTIRTRRIMRWVAAKEPNGSGEFAKLYAAALSERDQLREHVADTYIAQALAIADDSSSDRCESGIVNTEVIQRSKLRVDTRLKLAAKLAPNRYGDKVAITTPEPLEVVVRHFTGDAKP